MEALLGSTTLQAEPPIILKKELPPKPVVKFFVSSDTPATPTEQLLGKIWADVLKLSVLEKTDDFFAIGGNSINGFQVVKKVESAFGVSMEVEDLFEFLTFEELAAHIDTLLAAQRIEEEETTPLAMGGLPVYEDQQYYKVSHAQKRLWILDQLEGTSASYNMPALFEINETLDVSVLKLVFQTLIARHESLRTSFTMTSGGPMQKITEAAFIQFDIVQHDFRDVADQDRAIRSYLLEVSHASFDLKKAPLLRVDLLQLENEKYLLFINTHHIVSDGWSINVFFKEMSVLYFSLLAHQPSPLKPLRYQYKDYTIYQNSLLSTDGLKAHQEYWLKKFSGEIPVLNFPADRVSKQHAHKRGNRLEIKLERELYEQIQGIAREEHCTTFMVILSALKVLLYKYTGQTDIVVGTPLAERSHPELANQIGFYLDNLALRTQLDSSDTFDEVLRKVKATTIEAFTHKMYPFDRLVDDLGLSRDANKFPLFNIGLTWNTAQENHSTVIEKKVSIQGRELEERMVKTDIWFYGIESPNGISFSVEYDAELFRDQKIFNLLQHFKHLASQLSLQDRRPIRAWSILTQEERTVLVDEFNNGKTAIHGELNITSQFHRQVASTPGAEALVYKDKRMTYADLNRSANALAHYIIEHHAIKPGDFVGIYGYRSERLIIAILAILKAGATYVPMDVNSPKERIGKMLADANVSLLMTDSDLFFDITPHFAGSIVALDLELEKLEGRETNITIGSSNNYPAYVIFTSGSTGVPKGVLVGQEGVVNMIYEPNTRLAVTQEDVMALFFPISFDASVFQIFMALFSGATLVMLDDKILQDVKALPGYMKSEGVTIVTFSPSYLSLMQPEELSFLRAVLTGGEVAPFEQTLAFLPHMDYYNAYGPTEFSVCASMKKVGEEDRARGVIPIGGPIQNTEIYVLDQNHELVPVGVPGEICLAGKGLAHGYINRPELTHEKFVDNPFRKGEKMYKTGDLGQWHHDGVLEYCGRVDRQVKIRGYRIELSEIEAAIRSRVTVENCVVTPLQEANGEVVLAAYISGNGTYLPEDYKALLSQTLPAYMIPAYFVNVHQIPVTSNGKANLRALPDPTKVRVNQRDVQTPTNAVEENLLNLWLRILGDKEIGIHDNFFEIGGNSLKAIELVAAINNHWKNDLHLRDLFLKPTIAEQALLVTRPPEVERIPIKRIEEQEHYPVAHAQKGVYLLTHYERKAVPYNMTKYFKLNRIDVNILEKAVREFYRRHDSLRSTFHYINNEVRQIIAPLDDFKGKLMHEDFTQEEDAFMKVTKRMDEHVNVIFNKNEGPLCKLFLFHLPKHRYVLLILIDHIISDAWSVNQISDELTTLYRAFAQGEPSPLPEPKIQCYDYATWQVNYLKSAAFQELKSFWDAKLGGKNGIVDFTVYSDKVKSIDRVTSYRESMTKELAVHFKPMTPEETNDVMGFISAVIPYEGLAYRFVLNNEMKTRLIQFAQELQVSVYTVVFTSINILIYSAAKRTDVLSAVPVSTREQDEVKDQIGWFINKVLVASEMDGEATVETCVREAYHNILEAMDHATYPFSKLLNDYDRSLDTVCPVMVHYVGYDMNQAEEITDFSSEHLSFSLPSFDLNFTFYEKANGIETVLEYRSDIFTPEVIDQLMADYLEILDNMLDKNRKLDDLLTSKKMKLDEQIIETK
ncbi:MAG: amino acid adenylation domain-containing protein [Bacteroidota bacterium]